MNNRNSRRRNTDKIQRSISNKITEGKFPNLNKEVAIKVKKCTEYQKGGTENNLPIAYDNQNANCSEQRKY